jgi:hypothetical protein
MGSRPRRNLQGEIMNKQEIMELVDKYAYQNYSLGFEVAKSGKTTESVTYSNRVEQCRAAIEAALPDVPTVPDEASGDAWDEFFKRNTTNLATHHPSLLVRQLAQRLLSAAPEPAQPKGVSNVI